MLLEARWLMTSEFVIQLAPEIHENVFPAKYNNCTVKEMFVTRVQAIGNNCMEIIKRFT